MAIAGFDIGGTTTRYAVGNAKDGAFFTPQEEPTSSNPADHVESILAELEEDHDIQKVGIATTGVLSGAEIERLNTANHGRLENIDFSSLDHEVFIGNDVNLAALGEYLESEAEDLLYITFSTGIGAGVVKDGELLEGTHHNAGKIGAYPLEPEFSELTSKTHGCWEDICGGKAIPDFVEAVSDGEYTWSPEELYGMAVEDSEAREYVEILGDLNARGIATAVLSYDPEEVVLGGSMVLENQELFLETVKNSFDRYFPTDYERPEFQMASLGKNSGVRGALAYTDF